MFSVHTFLLLGRRAPKPPLFFLLLPAGVRKKPPCATATSWPWHLGSKGEMLLYNLVKNAQKQHRALSPEPPEQQMYHLFLRFLPDQTTPSLAMGITGCSKLINQTFPYLVTKTAASTGGVSSLAPGTWLLPRYFAPPYSSFCHWQKLSRDLSPWCPMDNFAFRGKKNKIYKRRNYYPQSLDKASDLSVTANSRLVCNTSRQEG